MYGSATRKPMFDNTTPRPRGFTGGFSRPPAWPAAVRANAKTRLMATGAGGAKVRTALRWAGTYRGWKEFCRDFFTIMIDLSCGGRIRIGCHRYQDSPLQPSPKSGRRLAFVPYTTFNFRTPHLTCKEVYTEKLGADWDVQHIG